MTTARPPVLVDAGVLFAAADVDDRHHARCAAFLMDHTGPLVVPQLVVAEVAHLMQTRLGTRTELLFLAELASGALSTEPVLPVDWLRITELVAQYSDFPLGTTDASVVTCAERLRVLAVATTDHRHFRAVRPAHVDALVLLPP